MTDLTTTQRILAFCVSALVITFAMGLLAYEGTSRVAIYLGQIADAKFPGQVALNEMETSHQLAMRALNALLIERADSDVRKRSYDRLAMALQKIEDSRRAFDALQSSREMLAVFHLTEEPFRAWTEGVERAVKLAREQDRLREAGQKADSPAFQAAVTETFTAWQAAAKRERELTPALLAATQRGLMEVAQSKSEASTAAGWIIRVQLLVGALGMGLLLTLGALLSQRIRHTLLTLTRESGRLSHAVAQGTLSVRGDPSVVGAEFRGIIREMNATMDAFMSPIQVMAAYVDRISRGDIPAKITDVYEGDFNLIKQNLNQCIDAVTVLVADADALVKSAVDGNLATRADASRHKGHFRKSFRV